MDRTCNFLSKYRGVQMIEVWNEKRLVARIRRDISRAA
jgi:hypothetical protein